MKKTVKIIGITFMSLMLSAHLAFSQKINISSSQNIKVAKSKLSLKEKTELFERLKICNKIGIVENNYDKSKDVICYYTDEAGRGCEKRINAVVEGSFTAPNSREMIIDIYDECKPHSSNWGEMLLVRDFKVIESFDRLGEGVMASVNTKSNMSLLLYIAGGMFQGVVEEYIGLCRFNQYKGTIRMDCKNLIKNLPIERVDIKDINGDGWDDVIVSAKMKKHKKSNEKIIKLIFDGENFRKE